MKNNLIIGVLVGLLILGAAITAVLSFRLINSSRELARHQPVVAMINNDRVAAQNLLRELEDYSKTHPAVQELLNQLRANTNQTATTTNR